MQPYSWMAIYRDGGYLMQVDPETGVESHSGEIDRSRLSKFVLQGQHGPVANLDVHDGDLFFYRRRTQQSNSGATQVAHLFGVTNNFDDKASVAFVAQPTEAWIIPTVELFSGFRPNHPWLYPIEPVAEELQRVGAA